MSEEVKMPLPRSLQEIVGSLLFASPDPLTASELREAIKAYEGEGQGTNGTTGTNGTENEVLDVYRTCTGREIEEALKGLGKALEVAGCGFELVCTGGTYRMQTVASCGRYVRAMLKMDRPSRLGRASLETLAIIAYRQPITKSEIEQIRGVDVTANIKTLMDLQLIRLVGKSELPGHPFLYGTTPLFLEHFGLSNLQQLNELDPTLQRSNPREKAAAYRKVEVEGEEEDRTGRTSKTGRTEENEGEEKVEKVGGSGEAEEEEVFIDDTPDEFDDEDDEEEEEEGEEDEEV